MRWRGPARSSGRLVTVAVVAAAGLFVLVLALAGAGIAGESSMLSLADQGCSPGGGSTGSSASLQASVSTSGRASIPADYLHWYQVIGQRYGISWAVLAGIGEVETNHGRSTLPGVHSGANAFGAAGPMQIGIGGAAGDTWGGAPVHPASEKVSGVATDADGDGVASVYDPADAIAGAARYLLGHGALSNLAGAVFDYNHLTSYVQSVLYWASVYSGGGFTVTAATQAVAQCPVATVGGQAADQVVAAAIAFARAQIGKPYVFGATGPDAFDCSGLVMMAYRAAGVDIPRTSQAQFAWGPRVAPSQVEPGDLVFFAGADGTVTSPGHVGLVIGHDLMIEAYATGFPLRVSPFGTPSAPPGDTVPVGFTRPWAHAGVTLSATS